MLAVVWAVLAHVPAAAAAVPPAVRPAFEYSWDTLSTYAFPGDIVGGNLTADQIAHFSKFSLLLYWGIDVRPDPLKGPGWYVPDQEAKAIAQAAALKAANPDIKLFPYITGFMAQTWFAAQAEFNRQEHETWWLKDPATGVAIDCNSSSSNCWGYAQGAPGRLYDWRIPAVRDYFTQKVIAPYADCENISGIFLDDTTNVAHFCMYPPHGTLSCTGPWTFTETDQRDFSNATMQHLEQALGSLDAKGKTAIVSTDVSAEPRAPPPLNSSSVDAMLLQHGALHFNEFFYGSEEDVQGALKLAAAGNPFMVHSSGPNGVGPFSQREYSLAAFLIVMGEYSYWGMGSGWTTGSFPWYPEYDRPLGKPRGVAESHGPGKYFREFEHLNVSLDTTQQTATILWHGLGPVPGPPPPAPPPPATPIGAYTSVKDQWIIHQNPPSYSDDLGIACSNQTVDGCAAEAAAACDALAGCTSFSVISKFYDGKVAAGLGPMPLVAGEANKSWSAWAKPVPTAGAWKPAEAREAASAAAAAAARPPPNTVNPEARTGRPEHSRSAASGVV